MVQNWRFRSNGGRLTQNFWYKGSPPTNRSSSKTRINDLSYGIKIWTDFFLFVTIHAFDRRTDRRVSALAFHAARKTFQLHDASRLPSILRPTIRECVHLVMCGHFRSHDKDVGQTIRSVTAENPMLYTNFTTLCVIEPELLPIEFSPCGNRHCRPFLLL